MPLWEYKVITSGKGGFATPALLEKFLNDLGREEWEIVHFHTLPDNALAFTGMARRTTQRDWTLEDAAAAAARTEADKLRVEFEAKFKGSGSGNAQPADEKPETIAGEKIAADDGMRRVRDTTRDLDPDADEEETKDEWDKITAEDELPTFFDAIRPHMRRNQRGPGMSVGVEFLAKKWNLSDDDVKGALNECGFPIPEDEDAKPVHIEYEGDLYWLNVNRRGELWLNTKEKPRPVFRTVQGTRLAEPLEEPTAPVAAFEIKPPAEIFAPSSPVEREPREPREPRPPQRQPEKRENVAPASGAPLPAGPVLLEKIRPLMRRNRRGAGGSGSTTFLSRALKCTEADLLAAFATLGMTLSDNAADKPVNVEIGPEIWWLNKDQRGGVWINGREKEPGETVTAGVVSSADVPASVATEPTSGETPVAATEQVEAPLRSEGEPSVVSAPAAETTPSPSTESSWSPLSAVRSFLKEARNGSFSDKLDRLAQQVGKSGEEFLDSLIGSGLKVPEKPREKPVSVENSGEVFWLSKNAKDELWLNAKPAKLATEGDDGEKKNARRGRSKKKGDEPETEPLPRSTDIGE